MHPMSDVMIGAIHRSMKPSLFIQVGTIQRQRFHCEKWWETIKGCYWCSNIEHAYLYKSFQSLLNPLPVFQLRPARHQF